ncbi:MAG: DUF975 family protein [Eubacteriales bacterium]|nr:DUF975 family protein [Eubacteriales bacterium]
MKNGIRAWKQIAKRSLKGNYRLPIMAAVILLLLNVIGSDFAVRLFPGDDALTIAVSQIFAFIVSLLITIYTTGVGYMYLHISRKEQASAADLIYFFKHQPDRILLSAFVVSVIEYVMTIPASYYGFTHTTGATMEELRVWMMHIMMYSFASLILTFIFTLPFKLTFYLLADDKELGSFEALKLSCVYMKKNWGKYLLLELSFIPWMLICLYLTFGIGFLWLIPYMKMSETVFYRNIRGELDGYFTDDNERIEGGQMAGGSGRQID